MGDSSYSEEETSHWAHNEGEQDYAESGGLAKSNPIAEFLDPTYDPPSGYEDEYGRGWKNAENQDPNSK